MPFIETTHLQHWADSRSAQSRFPHLVKALIQAVIQPEKLRMPSGDAVWLPGLDGMVTSGESSRFVPTGRSLWEVGTGRDFTDKANGDYEKRSKDRADLDEDRKAALKSERSQATFVFVTPRIWHNKESWVAERKAEEIWIDVWVIDGVDLQDWIETAPAVRLQLAADLALVPEAGLWIPDQAWEDWSHLTAPPASEELVVAGREEQEKELIGRLLAPPTTFTVCGDSPREAWGFALAVLRGISSEQERQILHARTIVADNEEVASRLRHHKNLIILLKQAHGPVPGFLSAQGCHVIVAEGNDSQSGGNVIVLTHSTHQPFAEALGRMGLSEDEAERATRACSRSVTIFQRQSAVARYERPRWADGTSVFHLLPALLAGRWNDRSEADRAVLCCLAGASDYNQVVSRLQPFLLVDEPPIRRIGEMWLLTAPPDAFHLTARWLTDEHLERFKDAFREVFGRLDPKVEIPPDEWLYHDLKGEQGHSGWLRSGMAETLLMIAERSLDSKLSLAGPRDYAADVVRGLAGLNDDWRVLASLRDQFPRLMEASPDPLLDSLERLLEARPEDVRRLFAEGEWPFTGGPMHTGLLWSLETMAWSPDYLPRVALLLARLASLDPGGRMLNRPINSLREIFLWWHLGTNAPLDRRLESIDLILAREPHVGWALLAKLLPDPLGSTAHGPAKPRWRDFGDLPEDARTRRGQLQYVSAIVDRALDQLGSDPDRWRQLLRSWPELDDSQQEKALNLLDAIVQGSTQSGLKAALWKALRDFTHLQRGFQHAGRFLSEEQIDRMEAVLSGLAPDDPVELHRWLFDQYLPDLPSSDEDLERHQEEVEQLRQHAVGEILQAQGVEGLVRLGTTCKFSYIVVSAAMPLIADLSGISSFAVAAIAAGDRGAPLVSQISGKAQELYGDAWRNLVRTEARNGTWPPSVIASLLIGLPNLRTTWEDATALGDEVAKEYWRRKPVFTIAGPAEDQAYEVDQLIEAGRAAEAFDRTALREEEVATEVLLRIFDATFDELARAQTAAEIRRLGVGSHDVRSFLDELRKRSDLAREELARREYRALPLLGPLDARGLALNEFMAEDPDFFIEVLCNVFLPAHRDKSTDEEPSPEVQARAEAAYSLLKGMQRIPGQDGENEIDEKVVRDWIAAVRRKAAEVDRQVVADLQIGQLLAHSPVDPEDGGWPHRVVRNLIEDLAADDVERGLSTERHNMRGIYTKALYEGGTQERALASQYRGWVDLSHARWPRMARLLESIAQSWERHAHAEDVRAEQEKWE